MVIFPGVVIAFKVRLVLLQFGFHVCAGILRMALPADDSSGGRSGVLSRPSFVSSAGR